MTEHPRRIDRVLSDSFLEGIQDQSVDDLHAMEREALEVETEISYVRRLAQGRIDILEASTIGVRLVARSGTSSPHCPRSSPTKVATRPRQHAGAAGARAIRQHRMEPRARALVSDATLVNLPTLSEAELQATLEQLRELEKDLSLRRRRAVHGVLDALTHAIASRLAPDPAG
jgi:hypothetical protein